jgi:hypothetical protein
MRDTHCRWTCITWCINSPASRTGLETLRLRLGQAFHLIRLLSIRAVVISTALTVTGKGRLANERSAVD